MADVQIIQGKIDKTSSNRLLYRAL